MSPLGSLRSGPLGVRSFRLLAGGQFTSTIGDYCYAVALPWLVLSNRGGAILLGTVLACYGVPPMVLIPVIAGVLVRHIGPSLFFPVAGGLVTVAILGGLTQREFGARTKGEADGADTPAVRREERAVG
jgi:hypothetical protein